MDFVCETPDTGRRWTSPDGGELGLADQLAYSTFHLFFNNFFLTGTSELKVLGTSKLEVPGTWELRNLKFRELGNFGTHSRVSAVSGVSCGVYKFLQKSAPPLSVYFWIRHCP